MKVALTGASGFIGRHVLAELSRHSVDITATAIDISIIPPIDFPCCIVELDMAKPPFDPYQALNRPDVLIHLAWAGLPNYRSLHHFEIELPLQYNFLKILIESGLPSLVVTGTCFEYGMQNGPLNEQLAAKPDNPYGYAKDALRRQLEFLQREKSFLLTWARLFYMYGEGQPESSLYTQIRKAIAEGQPVFNMSGGEQLRDYLSVKEIARYLVQLALRQSNTGIVNICSGKPISVRNLVETWIHENKWNLQIHRGYYPYPDYEPFAFWGDRSKLDLILQDIEKK